MVIKKIAVACEVEVASWGEVAYCGGGTSSRRSAEPAWPNLLSPDESDAAHYDDNKEDDASTSITLVRVLRLYEYYTSIMLVRVLYQYECYTARVV